MRRDLRHQHLEHAKEASRLPSTSCNLEALAA
jgi:hypothetical protein